MLGAPAAATWAPSALRSSPVPKAPTQRAVECGEGTSFRDDGGEGRVHGLRKLTPLPGAVCPSPGCGQGRRPPAHEGGSEGCVGCEGRAVSGTLLGSILRAGLHPQFTGEETKVWRGEVVCWRSNSCTGAEAGSEPTSADVTRQARVRDGGDSLRPPPAPPHPVSKSGFRGVCRKPGACSSSGRILPSAPCVSGTGFSALTGLPFQGK